MDKQSVLILFGGRSTEYEVSLISAASILENIDRNKYEVHTAGITKGGDWFYYDGDTESIKNGSWCKCTGLKKTVISPSVSDKSLLVLHGEKCEKIHIDVIFPVMHGAYSEDGTLQGLLQMSGIPFVGCKCLTSAVGMDKVFTKLVLGANGIHQAKSDFVTAFEYSTEAENAILKCERISEYPLFVKPANAGSSVGASKANDRESLKCAIEAALKFDDKAVVEEYIDGKEVECAFMGIGGKVGYVSTCGQIVPGSEFYDYDTKYSEDSTATYNIPAHVMPETASGIRKTAYKICALLGVTGLSRVDFFVREKDGKEEFIFNEINTLPGFTQISMYPKLYINDGMSYSEVIDNLILLALGDTSSLEKFIKDKGFSL